MPTYTMKAAQRARLSGVLPGPVEHVEGPQFDLKHWHEMFVPLNPFGLLLVNTTGGPEMFSIAGGPGRPGDVPRGVFSAGVNDSQLLGRQPGRSPEMIAGRWLANGAYVFFVSARALGLRRAPGLVAELIAADVPLVAALRQGEGRAGRIPLATGLPGRPQRHPARPAP